MPFISAFLAMAAAKTQLGVSFGSAETLVTFKMSPNSQYSALLLTGVCRHYVGNRVSFRTLPLYSLGLSVCNQIVSIRPVALCTLIGSVRGLVKSLFFSESRVSLDWVTALAALLLTNRVITVTWQSSC
jgi:hypothetical protein